MKKDTHAKENWLNWIDPIVISFLETKTFANAYDCHNLKIFVNICKLQHVLKHGFPLIEMTGNCAAKYV